MPAARSDAYIRQAAVGVIEAELGAWPKEECGGGVTRAGGVDESSGVADHQGAVVLEDRRGQAAAEIQRAIAVDESAAGIVLARMEHHHSGSVTHGRVTADRAADDEAIGRAISGVRECVGVREIAADVERAAAGSQTVGAA